MHPPVLLYGAGGHAKVILDMLEEEGRSVLGFFDDNSEQLSLLGYPVQLWKPGAATGTEIIVSIGDNNVRRKKAALVTGPFARVAHRTSYISHRAVLGEGSVVMSGVSIHSGAQVGAHCIVNTHASVDHDCYLEDFVHIAPQAALCGNVSVGEGTLIGAGAVVIPGIRIGRWSVIGAGSVIRSDVPDGVLVAGNPGRIYLKNNIL